MRTLRYGSGKGSRMRYQDVVYAQLGIGKQYNIRGDHVDYSRRSHPAMVLGRTATAAHQALTNAVYPQSRVNNVE
jgi:hypothetical protein